MLDIKPIQERSAALPRSHWKQSDFDRQALLTEVLRHIEIYHAVNAMLGELGAVGEITTRNSLVSDLMDVLHDYDGGVYQQRDKTND